MAGLDSEDMNGTLLSKEYESFSASPFTLLTWSCEWTSTFEGFQLTEESEKGQEQKTRAAVTLAIPGSLNWFNPIRFAYVNIPVDLTSFSRGSEESVAVILGIREKFPSSYQIIDTLLGKIIKK